MGPGSGEYHVADNVSEDRCVEICMEKRRNSDSSINGATWKPEDFNSSVYPLTWVHLIYRGSCWCKKSGSLIAGNVRVYRSCYLPPKGEGKLQKNYNILYTGYCFTWRIILHMKAHSFKNVKFSVYMIRGAVLKVL